MRREILNRLSTIEREFDVRIIFASESGSRAWGFASEDSDFDVRFVYCHPRDWYLSVTPGRDVIELDMTNDPVLDIRGWDVRKALGLVANSNMSPYEWLGSPISYRRDDACQTRSQTVRTDLVPCDPGALPPPASPARINDAARYASD